MSARVRSWVSLVGVLVLSGTVVFGVLGVLLPHREPPRLANRAAPARALTQHLLFVIVDGVRYDVATDPARMPQFSRAMREEASGELWAGRVSMTTSAILTIATGQRATFEQIVFNAFPHPPPYDSWLAEAKHAGLTVMCAGDPAWTQMFGAHIDERRLDPEGVAIDVDFNPETFRHARELRDKNPNLLIVHFTTPDHQAHAYTVPSARYAEHMRGFDRDLFAFLNELGPEWTMIVAGDHGASDSGTHGTDVPVQRRTVVWARGPGIVRGTHSPAKIDQADLSGTISALLGLPAPVHSRGQILTDWIDTPPELRERLACVNAERALALIGGETKAACSIDTAPAVVSRVDAELESRSGIGGGEPRWLTLAIAFIGLFTAFVVLRPLDRRTTTLALVGGSLLGALGIFLTWGVERLPGSAPMPARAALFTLGNLPALLMLLVPGRTARWAERAPLIAALMVPGFLVVTYTTNDQPEAYVAIVLGLVLIVFLGGLDPLRPTLRAARRVLEPAEIGLLAVATFALFFPGTRTSEHYPAWLRREPTVAFAVGLVVLALLVIALARFSTDAGRFRIAIVGALAVPLAFAARRVVGPIPGRAAIVVGVGLSIFFALRGRRLAALVAGLFTYVWISRDLEIVPLCATIFIASGAGRALARHHPNQTGLSFPTLLLVTAFLFGLTFVQRVGIQGAIDFGSMDWGAGGFGDPHVPAWVVGGALGLKYVVGLALALGAFVSWLSQAAALEVLRAVVLAFTARGVVLGAMFLLVGESFWTGLRVLGDLPFALIWAVTAAAIWVLAQPLSTRSSSS